jgi:hypothetical protein
MIRLKHGKRDINTQTRVKNLLQRNMYIVENANYQLTVAIRSVILVN